MAHSPIGRAADSISSRHWSSFAIELILIVVGILIALQIDNWVTDRENRRQEQSYLRALLVDLDTIEDELDSKLVFEARFVETADTAIQMIRNRAQGLEVEKFAELISTLSLRKSTRLDSPAFFDIVNSGGLALILDDQIKSEILNYFAAAERAELVLEKNSRDFVDNGFMPFVRDMGFGSGDYGGLQPSVPTNDEYPSLRNAYGSRVVKSLDEEAWQAIEVQVHWRGLVAYEDSTLAEEIRVKTQNLRRAIEAHLTSRSSD